METRAVLQEHIIMDGVKAWKAGTQRWQAFNAILRNHARHGRISMDDYESYVNAVQNYLQAQSRSWALDAPDIQ
jgi:hypothetical protein